MDITQLAGLNNLIYSLFLCSPFTWNLDPKNLILSHLIKSTRDFDLLSWVDTEEKESEKSSNRYPFPTIFSPKFNLHKIEQNGGGEGGCE